jgi:hypothetical protein
MVCASGQALSDLPASGNAPPDKSPALPASAVISEQCSMTCGHPSDEIDAGMRGFSLASTAGLKPG